MMPRMKFPCSLALSVFLVAAARAEVVETDIVIFGGTSGGVAAAVQAHRMGKTAVIAEWSQHLGGLTTGGLGATDIGNKGAIGGIAREFYEQIAAHYEKPEAWTWQQPAAQDTKHEKSPDPLAVKRGKPTKWTFEPHVAMDLYERWLKDAGVPVYLGEKLQSVKMDGARIVEFTTESGRTYRGKIFIDASYEGDLMAKAGVSYHVGREANAEYGETLNGVRAKTPRKTSVSPSWTRGSLCETRRSLQRPDRADPAGRRRHAGRRRQVRAGLQFPPLHDAHQREPGSVERNQTGELR